MKDRIKKIRKELDLTQQEFADRICVSRNNIASYETGKSSLGDAVISLICREFHVNEKWLRNGTGEMFIEQTRDEQIAEFVGKILSTESEDFKHRFVSALSRMSDAGWNALELVINELGDIKKGD